MNESIAVQIPVKLDAFVCNRAVFEGQSRVPPVSQPEYSALSGRTHVAEDVLDYLDLATASPAEINSRITDVAHNSVRRNRYGIYLSWCLPNVFRKGFANTASVWDRRRQGLAFQTGGGNAPAFRAVPNRWFVARQVSCLKNVEKESKKCRVELFVVESDRVRRLNEFGPEDDVEVMATPFAPANATLSEQGQSFLGLATRFSMEYYANCESKFAKYDDESRQTPLTVMTTANPFFSDLQPHHASVFSLHDDLSDLDGSSAKVSYFVFGYYHGPNINPIDPFLLHTQGPGQEGVREMFNVDLFRSASNEQDLHGDQFSLEQMDVDIRGNTQPFAVCHGALYDVHWDASADPRPTWPAEDAAKHMASSAPVVVGTTSTDAIIAYATACSSANLDEPQRAVAPALLRRLQGLMVQSGDDVDSHLQAADLISTNNFVRSHLGTTWHLKSKSGSRAQSSDSASTVPATDSDVLLKLRWVNDFQAFLDHNAREAGYVRHQLFCEWWRFLEDRFTCTADKKAIKARVKQLADRLEQLIGADTPMSPADLKKQLADMAKSLSIEASVGHPFHVQKDPVIGCAGLATGWPEQRGESQVIRLSKVSRWKNTNDFRASQWQFDKHDAAFVMKLIDILCKNSQQYDDAWRKITPDDSGLSLDMHSDALALQQSLNQAFFDRILNKDAITNGFSPNVMDMVNQSAMLTTSLTIDLIFLLGFAGKERGPKLSLIQSGFALIQGIRCRMQLAGMDISLKDVTALKPRQQWAVPLRENEFGEKDIYYVPLADIVESLESLAKSELSELTPAELAMLHIDISDMTKGIAEGTDPNDITKRLSTLRLGSGNQDRLYYLAAVTTLVNAMKPPGWGTRIVSPAPPEYRAPDGLVHWDPQSVQNDEWHRFAAFKELYTEWIFLHSCRTFGRNPSPYFLKHDRWAGQGWFPIMVEWEVKYFHIPFGLWEFGPTGSDRRVAWHIKDGVDLSKEAGIRNDTAIYKGRNVILPSVASQLESMIVRLFETVVTSTSNTAPVLSNSDKESLLQALTRLPFMSSQMDGLTAQMTTRSSGMHAKPQGRSDREDSQAPTITADSKSEEYGFDARTIALLGSEASMTPSDDKRLSGRTDVAKFKPVAHGQFHFTKLNIVDKFGQVVCALDPAHQSPSQERSALYPCTGDYLSCSALPPDADGKVRANTVEAEQPGLCSFIQVPPKINQEARWNAHHMLFDSTLKRWRPAGELENPMWGIIVINYIDRSLQLFNGDGDFLVEYAVGGEAGGHGARTRPWLPKSSTHPQLGALMERMKINAYLSAMYAVIENASNNFPNTPNTYASAYPAILGKPIALVTMGWSLELAQPPLASQALDDPAPQKALTGYDFPLKMGDEDAAYDGLVGYFDSADKQDSGFNFDLLRTNFRAAASASTPASLGAIEYAEHRPFWIDMTPENKLDFAALHDARLKRYAALVDPFTAVHGYSGILPTKQLQVPRWAADRTLSRMVGFFAMGPLLTSSDMLHPDPDRSKRKVRLPSSGLDEFEWLQPTWLESKPTSDAGVSEESGGGADGKTWYHSFGLDHVERDLGVGDGPFTAVEGFLKLRKKEQKVGT